MNKSIIILLIVWISCQFVNQIEINAAKPKNIILCIADGWGENHILASAFYHGQKQAYRDFPVKLYMCTYPAISQRNSVDSLEYWGGGYNSVLAWTDTLWLKKGVTGSGASGTALATGVKTNNMAIGKDVYGNDIQNITELAYSKEKATGVVTSVQFAHATPASFVAHNDNRSNYAEIARDMIFNSKLNVIMGCGHPEYDNNSQKSVKNINSYGVSNNSKYNYTGGEEAWNLLLHKDTVVKVENHKFKVQDIDNDGIADPWTLLTEKNDFKQLTEDIDSKRIIGIPKVYSTLQQARTIKDSNNPYKDRFNQQVPSLSEMTKGALNFLSKDDDGFFLMIEGGAIDWACHANQKGRLIEEQHDFDEMINECINWIEENSSWEETLLIITSDHETGFLTGSNRVKDFSKNLDGYHVRDSGKSKVPEMYFHHTSHTNKLIPVFAKGSGSEYLLLFSDEYDFHRGKYIQNSEIGQIIKLLLKD